MPKVVAEKNMYRQNVKKDNIENYQLLIAKYTRAGSKQARSNLKRKIANYRNRSELLIYLGKQIKKSTGEKRFQLLQLGIYLDRKQFLCCFLNTICETGHSIDDVSLINQFDDKPLDSDEQNELARHIVERSDYDQRLIRYLNNDCLRHALAGIQIHVRKNGLTSKYLQALANCPEMLDEVQDKLRADIVANPAKRKNWLRYLNVSDVQNQEFLVRGYGFRDIYEQFRGREFAYIESKHFKIRVAQQVIHGMVLEPDDWDELRAIIVQDVNEVRNIENNRGLLRLLKDASRYDYGFCEAMLITLHEKSVLYTDIVIDALAEMRSFYAYREMVNTLISTEDTDERYRNAVNLIKMYPAKASFIIKYTEDLGDASLTDLVKEQARNIENEEGHKPVETQMLLSQSFQILPHEIEIHELLYSLATKIGATDFFAAVGFVFSSGLQLFKPLIDYIYKKQGHLELIIGSLQNYHENGNNSRIDKKTVMLLNKLIHEYAVQVFSYNNSFFHGKFYYVGNKEKAYVIIGSTNISKTALLDNYELDTLFEIDLQNNNSARSWYEQFKGNCDELKELDEELFSDFNWNSELDVYNERILRSLTVEEVQQRISEVDDEEVKFRLETWMKHKPSDRFDNLGVPALKGYVAFVFEEHSLAVFESFVPKQAYYTFRCKDFPRLLSAITNMNKKEMSLKSEYLRKGYHIQDKDRLQDKIEKLFIRKDNSFL